MIRFLTYESPSRAKQLLKLLVAILLRSVILVPLGIVLYGFGLIALVGVVGVQLVGVAFDWIDDRLPRLKWPRD